MCMEPNKAKQNEDGSQIKSCLADDGRVSFALM